MQIGSRRRTPARRGLAKLLFALRGRLGGALQWLHAGHHSPCTSTEMAMPLRSRAIVLASMSLATTTLPLRSVLYKFDRARRATRWYPYRGRHPHRRAAGRRKTGVPNHFRTYLKSLAGTPVPIIIRPMQPQTLNQRVQGSSPCGRTNKNKNLRQLCNSSGKAVSAICQQLILFKLLSLFGCGLL